MGQSGYKHPYHTEQNPLFFSHYGYLKSLFEAVGPEQVSTHYESLSRSRRGVIFIFGYIGSILTVSRLGGLSHNEWIRGMIFHHEFLIAFYLGLCETRHFMYLPGPKFTIFYNVFTRYECQQVAHMWADTCEEDQMLHLRETKEQIEYVRLNKEYDFVKKRALINYLTNSRQELENHFHGRALNMLQAIERFEHSNLTSLVNGIGRAALAKVQSSMQDPDTSRAIKDAAFRSALQGLRAGSMRYENDPLMPILTEEINHRVNAYKNLSKQEEADLLSLNADQKRQIVETDKRDKQAFLAKVPEISNPAIATHPKFQAFVGNIKNSA